MPNKKSQRIRVLQYTYGGNHFSGIDSYLRDVYQAIDKQKIQFDFLYRYKDPDNSPLGMGAQGAKVFELEIEQNKNVVVKQVQEAIRLWRFFKENHEYDAIEINMSSVFMCIQCALTAKFYNIHVRIIHSHSGAVESRFKQLLKGAFKPILNMLGTDFWACSRKAGEHLFTKKRMTSNRWTWVKNVIDVERFGFDFDERQRVRADLGLPESLCVGIVGRFNYEKNHAYGLYIFQSLLRLRPEARLVLVGDGALREAIENQAKTLGIANTTLFLGERQDIPELMQALDVLLAPSHFEGFPLISLEAQAAGLPLVVSTAFPEETNVTGLLRFMSLEATPEEWARELIKASEIHRESKTNEIVAAGFDRKMAAENLESMYENIVSR